MAKRWRLTILSGAALLMLSIFGLSNRTGVVTMSAQAAGQAQQATPEPQLSISNDTCLSCHGNPNLTMTLENGETWGLFVPLEVYGHSIHAEQGYACVQCHATVGNYPHPPFSAQDARDASLQLYTACERCHASYYDLVQDSVHNQALQAGNRNAAICTDCHTAHTVRRLTDPATGELLPDARQWVPQTCAKCHYAIYQVYANSVHGAALLEEGNPDVPTCIDCHGVHNIEDPTTTSFRLRSPEICAGCHTDPEIMDKYGISTQVLDTYVSDFHGTTVTLFEKQHPDQETNKPVCYDCHGVHDIKSTSDPEKGLQVRENLLAQCRVCHPSANENFPAAWLSHYIPSPERHPLVFTVDTFYRFFIPALLGGMAILVALDASKLLRRSRRKDHAPRLGPEAEVVEEAQEAESKPEVIEPVSAGEAEAEKSEAVSGADAEIEGQVTSPPPETTAGQGEPLESMGNGEIEEGDRPDRHDPDDEEAKNG